MNSKVIEISKTQNIGSKFNFTLKEGKELILQ